MVALALYALLLSQHLVLVVSDVVVSLRIASTCVVVEF